MLRKQMARDRGGNTLRRATLLKPNGVFRDAIGEGDRVDFFRLTLRRRSSFSAVLSNLTQNATFTLLQNRRIIARSAQLGRRRHPINATLNPGTYFLQVSAQRGRTAYRLALASTAAVIPAATPEGLRPGEWFYSDEFGYERLPPLAFGFNVLYAGFPPIASYFGDEPDYYRALRVQYPSLAENLVINAMAMGTSRQGSETLAGRPDRIFINSRGESRFVPGFAGFDGFQPPGPQIINYPIW